MQTCDFVTIRLFLAIVRAGSIGEAARREHIATSAVSRRINDLEASLGVKLLRRLPRGVEPTPEGLVFAAHGERLLAEYHSLADALRDFASGGRGEVWFAAASSALIGDLPDRIARFRREYPNIKLDVTELYSREAVDAVREGRVDLAVITDTVDHRDLVATPYGFDPVWVIAAADHPLAAALKADGKVSFSEAVRHEVISLHQGGALDELIIDAARELGVTLAPGLKVSRFGSLRRMVEAGLGIGFMRRSSIALYLSGPGLVAGPLVDDWAQRHHVLVHAPTDGLSAVVQRFKDMLLADREGADSSD